MDKYTHMEVNKEKSLELKVQALVEKIASLTAQYENQAADYRVEITLLADRVRTLENDESETDASED